MEKIYQKLLNIQTRLKAPKGQFNAFGKYKYRNCEDILESLKPLCKDEKVVLWLSDHLVMVGDRYYIQATATLQDIENEGRIESTAYAREEQDKKGMDGSQVTGASSSYARKYALNALFDIDDTKDSDTTNTGHDDIQSAEPDPYKDEPVICDDCGRTVEDHTNAKGKFYSKNDIVYNARKNHSKSQCYSCYWKEENAKKAVDTNA